MSGVAALVFTLAAANVVNNRLPSSGYLPAHAVEIVLLLGVAAATGCGPADPGLAPASLARGLRWAGVAVAVVATAYALMLALPGPRSLLLDRRAQFGVDVAVLRDGLPVLVNTVILEELAFRGVLWGLLRRVRGATFATAASSVLFGVWHLLPASRLSGRNRPRPNRCSARVP